VGAFVDANFGTECSEAEEVRTRYNVERRRRQGVFETTSWEAVAGMGARRRQANLTQAAVPSALIAIRAEEAGEDDEPRDRYVRQVLHMPTSAGVVEIVYMTRDGQDEGTFAHRKLFKMARSEYLWGRCRAALLTGKFEQMARELGLERPTRELTFYELILPLLVVRRQSQYVSDDAPWSDDEGADENENGSGAVLRAVQADDQRRRTRCSLSDQPPKQPALRRAFFALDLPDELPALTATESRDRATRSALHALQYHIPDWHVDVNEQDHDPRKSIRRRGIQMAYSNPMEA
jgi:hypothetical protein